MHFLSSGCAAAAWEMNRHASCSVPAHWGPRTSPPFSLTPRLSSVGDTLQQQAAWNWAGLLPCAALCFPACFWGLQMRPPVLRPHADGVAGRAAQSPVPE